MDSSTIVVGVTGASVSRKAIDWAVQRAADRHMGIELVSVLGGAIGAVGEHEVIERAMQARRDLLEGKRRASPRAGSRCAPAWSAATPSRT